MKHASFAAICLAAALFAQPAAAQDPVRTTAIALPAPGESKIVTGIIQGRASADYVFTGTAGVPLRIDLKSSNTSAYFNLTREGSDEALFAGALGGNAFQGTLPESGTYVVKVYLMRNAARRNAKASYTLRLR